MKLVLLLSIVLCQVFILGEANECFTVITDTGKQLKLCQNETKGLRAFPVSVDDEKNATLTKDMDTFYIIICGVLVFWMQAGFSMLEAGCVSEKNVSNILFKNLMDAGIGAMSFWLIGYGFCYGGNNAFIGAGNNFLLLENDYHAWFFQWAFAATAATIVSGSVAERTKVSAYFAYSFLITAIVYPVVVHWVWDEKGWLYLANGGLSGDAAKSNGMLDFAGSGVVHMVGGFSGLCGAIAAGPRLGRFTPAFHEDGRPIVIGEHNKLLAALGVIILWMGWYGFNCGSTLAISGASGLAGKVAVTTSLAAASGMVSCMVYSRVMEHEYSLLLCLNGVLAGLVSVTASCATIEPWAAVVIGFIGAGVYICASKMLVRFRIDDPLDACPIHGFCGTWGILAVGIFSTAENIEVAFSLKIGDAVSSGSQLLIQFVGALSIAGWTLVVSGLIFFVASKTTGVRVSKKVEAEGLDTSEHGGDAYYTAKPGVQLFLRKNSEKQFPDSDNMIDVKQPAQDGALLTGLDKP